MVCSLISFEHHCGLLGLLHLELFLSFLFFLSLHFNSMFVFFSFWSILDFI